MTNGPFESKDWSFRSWVTNGSDETEVVMVGEILNQDAHHNQTTLDAVDYNQPQQSFKGNGITQSCSPGSILGFWVGKFMIHCGGVEI